jgi:hypothetical protein
MGKIPQNHAWFVLVSGIYLSLFLAYFFPKADPKKKKAESKPIKDKSFEATFAPFLGVPADLLEPILDDHIAGTISWKTASAAAYNVKAHARLAAYADEYLPALCHEFSQPTMYKDILEDEKKQNVLAEFKGTTNIFSLI